VSILRNVRAVHLIIIRFCFISGIYKYLEREFFTRKMALYNSMMNLLSWTLLEYFIIIARKIYTFYQHQYHYYLKAPLQIQPLTLLNGDLKPI